MIKIIEHSINIIMYHYVRPIKGSLYPNLKGLEIKDFENQINFFNKNFNVITQNDFIEILVKKKIPKKPSILLTFDDGYIDHYLYVFPILKKKKISGIFYPPVKTIQNKIVLDVNKIHFILEKELNRKKIINEINLLIKKKNKKNLTKIDINKIDLNSRYDDPETILIKKLLQYYLPTKIRQSILNQLFDKVINKDLNSFAKTLYMNENNIKEMSQNNMHFGIHGDYHYWWKYLNESDQEKEIKYPIEYYRKLGIFKDSYTLCFPYGSYNKITLKLLKKYNIEFALTTSVGSVNNSNINSKYILPRYDANDFLFL